MDKSVKLREPEAFEQNVMEEDEMGNVDWPHPRKRTRSLADHEAHRHVWQRDNTPGYDSEGEIYEILRCALCPEVWAKEGTRVLRG